MKMFREAIAAKKPVKQKDLNTVEYVPGTDALTNKNIHKRRMDSVAGEAYVPTSKKVSKIIQYESTDDQYSLVKTQEKKSTLAHPDGKHVHEIHHNGEKIGTVEPYSSKTYSKSLPGGRVLGVPKNVTRYQFRFDNGPHAHEMPRGETREHVSPKDALNKAMKYHKNWKSKQKDVNEATKADRAGMAYHEKRAVRAAEKENVGAMSRADKEAWIDKYIADNGIPKGANSSAVYSGVTKVRPLKKAVAEAKGGFVQYKPGDKVKYETSKDSKDNKGVVQSHRGDTVTIKGRDWLGAPRLIDVHHLAVQKESVKESIEEKFKVHATSHEGEKFISKEFDTRSDADKYHWKLAKGKKFKKLEVHPVKESIGHAGSVITIKDGDKVTHHELPANPAMHHITQELRKSHSHLGDLELINASRNLAAGKDHKNGKIHMSIGKSTPKVMEAIDEGKNDLQHIEVVNKFTGQKKYVKVHPTKTFATLNHHRGLWNTKSARIVSAKDVKEETEITELSKKTLGSYIKKAVPDSEKKIASGLNKGIAGHNQMSRGDHAGAFKNFDASGNDINKANKRKAGINRAIDKLTTEATTKTPTVGTYHHVDEDGAIGKHVVTSVGDGQVHTQNVKTKEKFSTPLRHWHSSSSPMKESVEQIDEILTLAGRMKRGRDIKKNAGRLAMGKRRQADRIADKDRLKDRAKRHARDAIVKRITKGIPKGDLSPQRRAEIEKRLDRMKGRIDIISRKILPQIRKDEIAKKRGNHEGPKTATQQAQV